MANIRGIRTQDLVSSSLIKRDVYDAIFNFKPYQTPVEQFFMAEKAAKYAVGNPKFELQEDVLVPHIDTVNDASGIAGGAATETITVSNGTYWKVGDIMHVAVNQENLRVTAVSTNDISVSKVGSGNITAAANASTLIRIAPAFAEGSASAQALSTVSTFPYNYTQITKEAVHMSGTQMATVNYGGSDWTNQRVKATEQFKLNEERKWWFGTRYQDTTAGAQIFFSGGILDSNSIGISNRSQFVGSDFATETYFFNTFLKTLFAKGTNEKVLYCGATALLAINDFSKVKQQTKVSEKEYGVDVQTIITPFGRAKLVWHPLLENDYANWAVGIDRDNYLKYAFLSGNGFSRDMQFQDNIGTVGTDERKAQYLAETGLHMAGGGQSVHRVLYPGASA